MLTIELEIDASRERIIDLTRELERFCAGRGDGLVNVFVPHATAGGALMETGSGSDEDLLAALERLVIAKNLADADTLAARKEAWADAYRHTPHGKPVELRTS